MRVTKKVTMLANNQTRGQKTILGLRKSLRWWLKQMYWQTLKFIKGLSISKSRLYTISPSLVSSISKHSFTGVAKSMQYYLVL